MELSDIKPENFFKKVTFASDPSPGTKIVVSNYEFLQLAILLKIDDTLRRKL